MLKLRVVFGLIGVTFLCGKILISSYVSADNDVVVDQVNINVPISCSMSGVGQTSHNSNISNGTYTADIGSTTIKVFCNDTNGFSIYAIGFTGDQHSGEDHTKLIGSSTNEKIVTGTATTTGNPDVSNWAMKLSTTTSPTPTYPITILNSFDSYHVVPDTYAKVATRLSTTDVGASATGSELTSTYAAYISKTQSADTYTGKVKYTLVHPASEEPLQSQTAQSGCINYFPNGNSVIGTMGCQAVGTTDTSAMLLASNYSRDGYGFAGWSDVFDYATNANAHFYGPQETIAFTAGQYTGNNDGLSLYAVWVRSTGNLQDSTRVSQLCGTGAGSLVAAQTDGTANLASVSALTDQRDNQTYAIAKLADGKCWMIENLRLESTNSDNSTGALAQGYGTSATYGNFTGLATAENANFSTTNPPVANSLYSTDGTTTNTIQGGDSSYYYTRIPRYNNGNNKSTSTDRPQNPSSNSDYNDTTYAGLYSYGNYYNWAAAMASIKQYNAPTDVDDEGYTSETANTSLCPSGWRLPYGRNTGNGIVAGGISYLDSQLGGTGEASGTNTNPTGAVMSNKWRSFPNNFLLSGRYYESSPHYVGDEGGYLSSTSASGSNVYGLFLLSSEVYPGSNYANKMNGGGVRCIVDSNI